MKSHTHTQQAGRFCPFFTSYRLHQTVNLLSQSPFGACVSEAQEAHHLSGDWDIKSSGDYHVDCKSNNHVMHDKQLCQARFLQTHSHWQIVKFKWNWVMNIIQWGLLFKPRHEGHFPASLPSADWMKASGGPWWRSTLSSEVGVMWLLLLKNSNINRINWQILQQTPFFILHRTTSDINGIFQPRLSNLWTRILPSNPYSDTWKDSKRVDFGACTSSMISFLRSSQLSSVQPTRGAVSVVWFNHIMPSQLQLSLDQSYYINNLWVQN